MTLVAGSAAVLLAACGSGPSVDELAAAREQGAQDAKTEQQQEQLESMQDRLDRLQSQNSKVRADAREARRQASRADRRSRGTASGGGQSNSSGTSGGAGTTACGNGVYAGPNTSCPFAMNVAGEWGSNPGSSVISAYSPVTGLSYTMSCTTTSSGHVCRGGNNASVFFP